MPRKATLTNSTGSDLVLGLHKKSSKPTAKPATPPPKIAVQSESPAASPKSSASLGFQEKHAGAFSAPKGTSSKKVAVAVANAIAEAEDVFAYKVRTHDENGDPIWLHNSTFRSPKKGPSWQHDEVIQRATSPIGSTDSSDELFTNSPSKSSPTAPKFQPPPNSPPVPSPTSTRSLRSGSRSPSFRKMQEALLLAKQRSVETAVKTYAEMADIDRKVEVREHQLLEKSGRRGRGDFSDKTPSLRDRQVWELRQTNLINHLIFSKMPLEKLRKTFERHMKKEGKDAEGVSFDSFVAIVTEVAPDAGLDRDRLQGVFQTFDSDGNGIVDFVEWFSLMGILLSPPEKDWEVSYVFNVVADENRDTVPVSRLCKAYLLGLKQADAAKRRWARLAVAWERALKKTPPTKKALTLDDVRVLVYGDRQLWEAHDRLRPFAK